MAKISAQLQEKLENLPDSPGIYQFLNDNGTIIYVGKGKSLRNRVRSYFNNSVTSPKTLALVSKIADIELILTKSEIEALMLENNLIKQYKPRYNVLLKDDKTFPYIKVTGEAYPRVYPTRRVIQDGGKYFGPYTEVRAMRNALRIINHLFKVRSCKLAITEEAIEKKKFKICLDFHIGKCDGPCEGLISSDGYSEIIKQIQKLLTGKTGELIQDFAGKMHFASKALQFEKAKEYRDKIQYLEALSQKQRVVASDTTDRDIIAVAYQGNDAACCILNIDDGKLVGKKQLRLSAAAGDEEEILSAVIKQYYSGPVETPTELVVSMAPADEQEIIDWLGEKSGKKVKITVPQRGALADLLRMSSENAKLVLGELQLQKMKKEGKLPHSLTSLKRDLFLPVIPRVIECFDISNLHGSDIVASMVVFEDARPKKSAYRKFIIRTVENGPDDFASMYEAVSRRYTRVKEEGIEMPDLILIDGGKGQLNAAREALSDAGIKGIAIAGLAKRLEEVFLPGKKESIRIPKTSSALRLIQRVRDEAHRFAVTFHRSRRDKRIITTELTEIEGIGKSMAEKLLKAFGSVENIKSLNEPEIAAVTGPKKAGLIYGYFNPQQNDDNQE